MAKAVKARRSTRFPELKLAGFKPPQVRPDLVLDSVGVFFALQQVGPGTRRPSDPCPPRVGNGLREFGMSGS